MNEWPEYYTFRETTTGWLLELQAASGRNWFQKNHDLYTLKRQAAIKAQEFGITIRPTILRQEKS